MSQIAKNVEQLNSEIKDIQAKHGLSQHISICVASKYASSDDIQQLYKAGIRTFGENRLQEALNKQEECTNLSDISWHFIGRIQSNKIKKIVAHFDVIQSVDSVDKCSKINDHCLSIDKTVTAYLQVNIGNDPNKQGFTQAELLKQAETIFSLSNIDIRGIMIILPLTENKNLIIDLFNQANNLFIKLKNKYGISELSMGMSGDYKEAIICGATTIRVGRLLFK